MNENLYRELDALVAKKKTRAISKADAELYAATWLELARIEGYSKKAEDYFFDGMAVCGAVSLEKYIVESVNPLETLKTVMHGEKFKGTKETSAVFRALVHLMALVIVDDAADKALLCPIIQYLPSHSKAKSGNVLGEAPRTMQKYFLDEVSLETQFPDLRALDMKPVFIEEFTGLMDEVFGKVDSGKLTKTKIQAMAAINRWLHPLLRPLDRGEGDSTENKNSEELNVSASSTSDANTGTIVSVTEGTSEQPIAETALVSNAASTEGKLTAVETASMEVVTGQLADVVKQLCAVADTVKKDIDYSHDAIFQTKRSLDAAQKHEMELQNRLAVLEKEKAELEKGNQDLVSSMESLTSMKRNLEAQVRTLNEEIAACKQEIAQLIEAKEVLTRDRAKQSEDRIRRLASKLQAEYTDFMDADGIPMSEDLGENMRLQLRNVFDILINAGIPLK